jgi:hypothetical protein
MRSAPQSAAAGPYEEVSGMQCLVVRGLAKEVEEDLNKFFASHPDIRVHHMSQSSTGEYISLTLLYDEPKRP